jgi:hypothetical protein
MRFSIALLIDLYAEKLTATSVHTAGVTGSNPVPPTRNLLRKSST